LNQNLCSLGGLFGAGIYLAEDVEKIDQYTTADGSYKATGLEDLHARLFRAGGNHHLGEDLFYCFVVRTACGWPVRTKDKYSNLDDPSCDWVYANPDKDLSARRALVEAKGVTPPVRFHFLVAEAKDAADYILKRFREFVCFESSQTYCEYLLAYKRV